MPVPAAGLADVVARDPQPLVLGGRGEHPLEQLAVARLQLVLLAQCPTRNADALGERVTDPLQLREAGDVRLRAPDRYAGIQLEPLKGLAAEVGKLAFETTDLTAQLRAREALVAPRVQRLQGLSIEQIRHRNRDRV